MWFMNNILNPLMRLILRSPLHGLMSAGLLLITYRGKKSGKEYTLPVQYAESGKSIYIIPGMPEQKTWWRNLKGGLPVSITLRGQVMNGNGVVLEQPEDAAEIICGLMEYLKKSPALAKNYRIGIAADSNFNAADLRKVAETLVIIRVWAK